MIRSVFALVLSVVPAAAAASPDYCEIAGLAIGADKEFVGSVASELANRQNSVDCDEVMSDAMKRGKRLMSGKRSKAKDEDLDKLLKFEAEVLDAVIKNMRPDE